MNKDDISQRLRLLRGPKKIREAALKADVLEENWSRWEKGHVKPSRDALFKIAASFGVSALWILHGEGKSEIKRPQDENRGLGTRERKALRGVENVFRWGSKEDQTYLIKAIKLAEKEVLEKRAKKTK